MTDISRNGIATLIHRCCFIGCKQAAIRDITKPIELAVEYGGTATDPYGQVKSGFEINGKINRKDFGLTWSALTEAGGVVLSDEVKLLLNVQMIKQA